MSPVPLRSGPIRRSALRGTCHACGGEIAPFEPHRSLPLGGYLRVRAHVECAARGAAYAGPLPVEPSPQDPTDDA